MSISTVEIEVPLVRKIKVTKDTLSVELTDGRSLGVPLAWFPRLLHGSAAERAEWRLIGGGTGIHWPALDEDISVEGLLAGRSSGECQSSLAKWLQGRKPRRTKHAT